MNRKEMRTLLTLTLAIICLGACCSGTLSYMTAKDEAKNTFTVGSQVSKISEVWNSPEFLDKGKSYTKKVSVKNTGTVDCYVRVFAGFEDADMADSITVDWNTSSWTAKQSDGYYYYKERLKPGAATEPLFTKLTATADVSNLRMIVYEETVQAAGSAGPKKAFNF